MARELHRAGVATDILESTVGGIAHAIGLPVQIFALPTYITLAIGSNLHQHVVMLRVAPGTVDLRKIAILNLIFDDLVAGKIDFRKASALLSDIDKRWPRHRARYDVPALAMVALGVAVLLGGGVREMIVATVIGACVGAISALGRRVALVGRLFEVIAAFVSTLIVALGTHILGPTNVLIAIVAGVVVLLPGYSLTLALYELANSNLVAGTARLGKVLSTLLALACGALLGFAVVGPSLLNTGNVATSPVPGYTWFIAAALMSIGLAIDLDARIKDFAWVFAACAVALLVSHVLALSPLHPIAPFIAAFACGIIASLAARWLRVPQPIMLVPALLVLVPGSISYESVLFAFRSQVNIAVTSAANAAIAAILLVAGLLLSQLLIPSSPLLASENLGRLR